MLFLFFKKDEFGFRRLRKPSTSLLVWIAFWSGCFTATFWLASISCSVNDVRVDIPIIEDYDNDLVFDKQIHENKEFELKEEEYDISKEPPVITEGPKLSKHVYRMIPVETRKRLLTTYSKWDSPAEEKGIYANQKFANYLNIYERRIRDKHYTVALNLLDDYFHNRLVKLPDGSWTHKFRVHVDGYNKSDFPNIADIRDGNAYLGSDVSSLLKAVADSDYFSAPRDRMSHGSDRKNRNGRCDYCSDNQVMDVLHTGYPAIVKQKQKRWMRTNQRYTNVDFWEIARFAVYSDGSERQVSMDEAFAVVDSGKVNIIEVKGGSFTE